MPSIQHTAPQPYIVTPQQRAIATHFYSQAEANLKNVNTPSDKEKIDLSTLSHQISFLSLAVDNLTRGLSAMATMRTPQGVYDAPAVNEFNLAYGHMNEIA